MSQGASRRAILEGSRNTFEELLEYHEELELITTGQTINE
jgi:hypothetical protein